MENRNVLEGFKCPKCGASYSFDIEGTALFKGVTDDGTNTYENVEWDMKNFCRCAECGHQGKVGEFLGKEMKDPLLETLPLEILEREHIEVKIAADGHVWVNDEKQCLLRVKKAKAYAIETPDHRLSMGKVKCPTCKKIFYGIECPRCGYARAEIVEICPACNAQGKGFHLQGSVRLCNACGAEKKGE